jgi:hypothetical protein
MLAGGSGWCGASVRGARCGCEVESKKRVLPPQVAFVMLTSNRCDRPALATHRRRQSGTPHKRSAAENQVRRRQSTRLPAPRQPAHCYRCTARHRHHHGAANRTRCRWRCSCRHVRYEPRKQSPRPSLLRRSWCLVARGAHSIQFGPREAHVRQEM